MTQTKAAFIHQIEADNLQTYRLPWGYLKTLFNNGITPIRALSDVAIRDLMPYLYGPGTIYELGTTVDYYRKMVPAEQTYILTDLSELGDRRIDMTNMDFEDNSVDAFFTAFAIEHIDNYQKAFTEMYRTLKPGGRALIVVPFLYYYHGAPDDYVRFTASYLRKLLSGMKTHRLFGLGSRALFTAEMYHEKPFTRQSSSRFRKFIYRILSMALTATYIYSPHTEDVFPSAIVALAEKPLPDQHSSN